MDVLSAYQKVMEIFGALGGVVHLAGQVSTTPFEDLSEGEYFELMAENVRSTFLALKAASRLLSGGWVVIVAPPGVGSVQMAAVQGALRQMVDGFRQRFAYPRVNLVLPSRQPSDPRHDQALVRAVRFLGSPESAGVSGQIVDVELPNPPRVAEALLPEVRAALDPNVRQADHDWQAEEYADWHDEEPGGAEEVAHSVRRFPAGAANHLWYGPEEGQSVQPEDEQRNDLDHEFDDSDYWANDLGLPDGPALRHLVADDDPLEDDLYASGHQTAFDLYGDLASLEFTDDDDADLPGPTGQRR
jgi:hypothetical protein